MFAQVKAAFESGLGVMVDEGCKAVQQTIKANHELKNEVRDGQREPREWH
jgi:hypothetical protein